MTSFQTIRLARGRHASPKDGVCVAELASMLAGERFSDHPSCACPAVTAFLRAYNDRLDDARRQDLFALASDLVGSRRAEATTSDRVARLVVLAWRHRERIGPLTRYPHLAFAHRFERCAAAGDHLGRLARRSQAVHEEVLACVADLLAGSREAGARRPSGTDETPARVPGGPAPVPEEGLTPLI